MKLYIDTEFNDFRGELISMALVADDGTEFYEVLECKEPTEWVATNVMPILEKSPLGKLEFQLKLQNFLSEFDSVHIIADWPEDLKHFCESLILGPGMKMSHPTITMAICPWLSSNGSLAPHNALYDARAIMMDDLENTYRHMK
jgi:hypothetical protein